MRGKDSGGNLAALRERLAATQSRLGFHPYWSTCPVVADEPLWGIMFREPSQEKWVGQYRTATRDLDKAIAEARQYLQVSDGAEASVHPTVPRSDSYRGAERMLVAMLLAVPADHLEAGEMFKQIRSAQDVVVEAKREGRYFGPLTIDLPIVLEVDDFNLGRPRPVKMVTWMDPGGWPEWNRCTIPADP
jgi:hypothetical protein